MFIVDLLDLERLLCLTGLKYSIFSILVIRCFTERFTEIVTSQVFFYLGVSCDYTYTIGTVKLDGTLFGTLKRDVEVLRYIGKPSGVDYVVRSTYGTLLSIVNSVVNLIIFVHS